MSNILLSFAGDAKEPGISFFSFGSCATDPVQNHAPPMTATR
jgi:hypothetical protein